jgi:hypothetical protein
MLGKLLDRFCFNTIFLFIAVLVILGGKIFSPKNERPEMKNRSNDMTQSAPHLPQKVGMWTGPYSPQIVTEKNIFDYMDGAGELYLGYRFDHLEVYEYTSQTQEDILVELYFMETSDDAFGLLSLDWGGDQVDLNFPSGNQVSLQKKEVNRPGWPLALYGDGLLRLRADEIYARVMATRETPESKQAVLSLGRSIAKGRSEFAAPLLLKELPESFLPDWAILKDRAAFFRSHLVLNSLYYLSHENILDLDLGCEAVTVPYQKQNSSGGPFRFQYLLIRYLGREQAKNALTRFHKAYLPEHPPLIFSGSSEEMVNIFAVEHGWLAYRLKDNSLGVIFDGPDRETAGALIDQLK